MPKQKKPAGEAFIIGGAIVIRVPIKNLPVALQCTPNVGEGQPWFKITDAKAFAQDLLRELNREDEQGTTRVHAMLDAAMLEAIDQGAEGVVDAPMKWE